MENRDQQISLSDNLVANKIYLIMKKSNHFFLTLLFIGIATVVNSQTWTQVGDEINGEAAQDHCGKSVSLSSDGMVIAIGAPQNSNDNGSAAGHVRIYEKIEGTWTQIGDDIDGEDDDNLSGHSVSLSSDGSIVAIGAPKNHENGNSSGHVRVYENNGGNWSQIGNDIDGEMYNDWSGWSVSLSSDGAVVAIGARYNGGNGNASGHVRIYQYSNGDWIQIGDDIDGKVAGEQSGSSVSLSNNGSVVAIGSPIINNHTGVVRVYQDEGGLWTQIGEDINGETEGDYSGEAISLSSDGSVVAIGAHGNDENGGSSGNVRIFKNDEGIWTQVGDDIYGDAVGDFSGISVDLNSEGSVVAIGSYQNNESGSEDGYVRVFHNNNGIWTQVGDDITGITTSTFYGMSTSLSSDGSAVAIGFIGYWEDNQNIGHVKIYTTEGTIVYEFPDKTFLIYPNPTTGIIKFDFTKNRIQQIIVSDISGKTIIEKSPIQQNETIDLSGYEDGIYTISVQTDKEVFTTKIVKE